MSRLTKNSTNKLSPVVCSTCGDVKYYSAAVAARKRYCDNYCYTMRPPTTLAHAMIRSLGGYHELAVALSVVDATVKSWLQNGIPQRYHETILGLARQRRLGERVTMDKLRQTQSYGRAHRDGRAGPARPLNGQPRRT